MTNTLQKPQQNHSTALISAYTVLMSLFAPIMPLWVNRRSQKGKEDPDRKGERYGKASRSKPMGRLFWLHGASVGEVTMMLPLIDRVLREHPYAHVLVTSGTVTSANLLAQRLPLRVIHQYAPLDTPKAVTKFLDHWQPDMALWTESEIWPNLIMQTRARNIPMALINARLSHKSIENWHKRQKSARTIFGCFDMILAANNDTAKGLSWLLGSEIQSIGNLKDAAPALPVDSQALTALQKQIRKRPVWCAASTHPGEEAIILAAHEIIKTQHPDALLILALRHPDRRKDVLQHIIKTSKKTSVVLRSDHDNLNTPKIKKTTSVFLFDTIGEMGLAYSLSDLTFVCGSLIEGLTGHNPLEPARFSNAILTGAHIASFAETYMQMFTFDAAQRILSPEMIGPAVSKLLSDPQALAFQQKKAQDFSQGRDAVLDFLWDKLIPIFPEPLSKVKT